MRSSLLLRLILLILITNFKSFKISLTRFTYSGNHSINNTNLDEQIALHKKEQKQRKFLSKIREL